MSELERYSTTLRAPALAAPTTPFAPWLRLHLSYWWRHRRRLSLARPTRFTELVQRRKLHDRDQRLPHLIDKVAVKRFVAEMLGPDWVTPTLWSGDALPAAPAWPAPFVVKSRHGCNQRRFVRDGSADWPAIRRAAALWMRRDYGRWLDEWGYRGVTRGVLVEPFVGDGTALPVDYKFYVFHGRVAAVQVHLDREHGHRWMLFDPAWQRLSSPTADADPAPPATLDRMVAGAETLARGFDFVRVDFYDAGATPRFSEMTFYPGSGLDPFDPPALDAALGGLWHGAA
ncbi:N/A [soil metagenome]